MIVETGVLLIVEIVEEADDAPHFLLLGTNPEFPRVGAHASFDGERMFAQTF
jgi:hypothetical protein